MDFDLIQRLVFKYGYVPCTVYSAYFDTLSGVFNEDKYEKEISEALQSVSIPDLQYILEFPGIQGGMPEFYHLICWWRTGNDFWRTNEYATVLSEALIPRIADAFGYQSAAEMQSLRPPTRN